MVEKETQQEKEEMQDNEAKKKETIRPELIRQAVRDTKKTRKLSRIEKGCYKEQEVGDASGWTRSRWRKQRREEDSKS